MKSLLGENQAEPKDIAAAARREADTARRTTATGKDEPATSTGHAVVSTISTSWIYL